VAYKYEVPIGSIMLVSDMPLKKRGIKDKKLHDEIYSKFMPTHLELGLDAAQTLDAKWHKVERRLISEW
jgi:AMP nucleosidase